MSELACYISSRAILVRMASLDPSKKQSSPPFQDTFLARDSRSCRRAHPRPACPGTYLAYRYKSIQTGTLLKMRTKHLLAIGNSERIWRKGNARTNRWRFPLRASIPSKDYARNTSLRQRHKDGNSKRISSYNSFPVHLKRGRANRQLYAQIVSFLNGMILWEGQVRAWLRWRCGILSCAKYSLRASSVNLPTSRTVIRRRLLLFVDTRAILKLA